METASEPYVRLATLRQLHQVTADMNTAGSLADTLLTVWETTPKQALVRRSGKPLMQYITDTKASYSVLVTAPDPRRYSTTQSTGTTALPSVSGGLAFPITFPITFSATARKRSVRP